MIQKINDGYIINIDKPEDWTSYDVVRKVKVITHCRKVGHAGTLDPFATGVLLICLNKATKLTNSLMEFPKEYQAVLSLGKTTDTLDFTGNFINHQPIPKLNSELIIRTLSSFRGKIKQRIPKYSASKINGQRSYKLARQGQKIPVRTKYVFIHSTELVSFDDQAVEFRVVCSKGTYIRMLGYDIAQKLGTVGFLTKLRRIKVGEYSEKDAITLSQFEELWHNISRDESISEN